MKVKLMKRVQMSFLALMIILSQAFIPLFPSMNVAKADMVNWLTYKFDIDDFSEPALQELFQLNGTAAFVDGKLVVTPKENLHIAGSAFNKQSFQPHAEFSFSTGFSFEIRGNLPVPADGMAFAIVADPSELGGIGGHLGLAGVQPSLGLKFDTYVNTQYNDPSNNYIGIAYNGDLVNNNPSWYYDFGTTDTRENPNPNPEFVLANGTTYYTWIDYDGASSNVKVYFNDSASKPSDPLIDANDINLKDIFGDANAIYAGFTASGNNESHEILSWYFVNEFAPIGDLDDTDGYKQAPSSIEMLVDETAEAGKYRVTVTAKNADGTVSSSVPVEVTSGNSGVWTDLDGNEITDWSTMLTNEAGELEVYFFPDNPYTYSDLRAVAVGGAIATDEIPAKPIAPGGVSNGLVSWVDVGKSAVKNSENHVTELNDLAAGGGPWKGSDSQPQPYNPATINFNPGITITPDNGYFTKGRFSQTDTAREIFSVQSRGEYGFEPDKTKFPWEFGSASGNAEYGTNNGSEIRTSAMSTTGKTINTSEFDLLKSRVLNVRSSATEWTLSLDGKELERTETNQVKRDTPGITNYYIGAGHNSRFYGSISEVILYNRTLEKDEQNKIYSYLALKYGLTLRNDSGEPVDYVTSNDAIIWSAEQNNGYNNRITGIGKDNASGLEQKQSRSEENGANVTVAIGDQIAASNEANQNTILNDNSYFVFGDNGASTEFIEPADKTDENLKRMGRIYKVQKTNWQDVDTEGDTKITLGIDKVDGATDWPLYVVVSSDEQFDAEDSFYLIEDGKVTIDTKDFGSISYFTIAASVPVLENAVLEQTETDGARVVLTFDQEIELSGLEDFTITIDGEAVAINEVGFEVNPSNRKQLVLTLPAETNVTEKELKVNYGGTGTLKGTNGVPVDEFEQVAIDEFASELQIIEPTSEIVSISKPAIEGTAIPGATISIVIKDSEGKVVENAGGTTTVDEDGQWVFTPSVDLDKGTYTIEVTATKDGRTATKTKELTIVDKTALEAKVDEINGLVETDYTEESWEELEEALNKAREVLDNEEATQEEVDEALEKLEAAQGALTKWVPQLQNIEVNDQNKLELTFDKPIALEDLDGLTVEVNGEPVNPISFVVDGEKLTLTLPQAVEAGAKVGVSYDEEAGNLKGTNGEQVASFEREVTIVDKTALEAKVDEINGLVETDYTEESWEELEEALNKAREVLDNEEATQEEVDEALEKLEAAQGALTKWVPQLQSIEVNDQNKIEMTFDKPIALEDLDGLTVEVNGELVNPISFVVDGEKLTLTLPQAVEAGAKVGVSYDEEAGNLKGTNGEPVRSFERETTNGAAVDKSALQAEVDRSNSLTETDYTADSWATYEDKLREARIVLTDSDATQEEVDAALEALENAREALTRKSGLVSIVPSIGELNRTVTDDVYTMTVGNSTTEISFTVTPVNPDATITINGKLVESGAASDPIPLQVGVNEITIVITEKDGSTRTYTINVTRESASSGGTVRNPNRGGTSQPATERITVDVEAKGKGVVAQTEIVRTTNSDGTKSDKVTFGAVKAAEAVRKTLEAGADAVRIVIPDDKDEVKDVRVDIPTAALNHVQESGLDLEIYTDNGLITIPNESLVGLTGNLYFYLVPIKQENERKQVEERAKKEQLVREVLNDGNVYVVDRPFTIETNMPSRPVTITLPMDNSHVPTDAAKREAFMANLAIFIEHSDGERKLVTPEIGDYADGKLGLSFGIEKFSTFTILNLNADADGYHSAYIIGYTDGTFKPANSLSRSQVAAILHRVVGLQASGEAVAYPDVPEHHWASESIAYASKIGLMEGMPDGSFQPDRAITRAELAAIIARWKELKGEASHSFNDVAGHWAEAYIAQVFEAGYMEGMPGNVFQPDKILTRAEAVVVFNRVLERGPLYGIETPTWPDAPMSHWAFHHIEEASRDHYYKHRREGGENIVE